MQRNRKQEQFLHWAAAALVIVGTSVVLSTLRASDTTASLVYLVFVVWFATVSGFWLSLFVAVVCAAAFDFFFLPPFHTMSLQGSEEWIALASFLLCSIVVSRVAELARQQKLKAEQRRADVERLYALSQEMMLYEDAERLLGELPRLLCSIFSLDSAALYVNENDGFYASGQDWPMGIHASLQAAVLGPQPVQATTGDFVILPLMLGLRPVGALAWKPDVLSREVAAAVAAQVAIAVARSMATEAATRLEAAREAERLRTALIDSLTHELRTPLTAIRAAATTLLSTEGLDEEGRKDMAALIDEESAQLDMLIGEAVEMAEIDANSVHVHLQPHTPRALLEHALEASGKNLAGHRVVIDPAADEATAWFDSQLLGRVLRHLLENAAAYTPPGTTVWLASHRSRGRLEFSVRDSGPGIDSRDLPLIFEKFYRGKRKTGPRKGSGMGLAIARAILIAHGGGIEASSEPGQGTHFRFWVPLVNEPPPSIG